MTSFTWPAIITLLNLLLLIGVAVLVGRARAAHAIAAPATTGHPAFERAFRVQMNTLENSVVFLPALWLAALYSGTTLVALTGLAWIGARIVYAVAYARDPARRGGAFGVSFACIVVLMVAAAIGLVRALAG